MPVCRPSPWLTPLLLCGCLSPIMAWWDSGHMLVGQIASQCMNASDVETLHLVLRQWDTDFPNTGDITTAAIWADLIKCNSVVSTFCPSALTPSWELYNSWHFADKPVPFPHTTSESTLLGNKKATPTSASSPSLGGSADQVLTGIVQTLRTTHSPWTANQALRLFIHIFGDIHNPLHAATAYSATYLPHGDAGGTQLGLHPPCAAPNLHALWDSIGGVYTADWSPAMDADSATRRAINANATHLLLTYARLADPLTFGEWQDVPYDGFERAMVDRLVAATLAESHDVAGRVAYADLTGFACDERACHVDCPDDAYVQRVVKTAEARVVLGGRRLAVVLTQFAKQVRALGLVVDGRDGRP
ncbi:Aste57867_2794 [Aphanomyces stellatus]|uniref:Aste57867_2794 protein n=1 Tax=Aphanomyces stellatus TaxID=120398 RepID=A0A485KCK9_9STRA|nr:hypothetical protein As57867_002787 [Aphanomyces stellatus]VFT79984.1 Aste57867_2794 [Aphanomyces stellatus]